MHLSFRISLRTFLSTLAPHAYVTYYQARWRRGHTSPCGEFACFYARAYFFKSKVGTLHWEKKYFFLREPCILRTTSFFDANVDQLSFELVKTLLQLFRRLSWRRQASLVEEAQDGVLHHNAWCSGTSCGGINPYTLTTRLEPGGLAHYEACPRLDPIAWCFVQGNKTWRSSRILIG